jgi:ABC-2 type transport system ATP-binding protein
MNPAILTSGVSRRFGRTVALDGVNLAVPEGAIYALVGANGAGKTTMIKLLMNILRPSSGRADVLGAISTSLAGKSFIRIGYVSENQELPGWMTVGELLDYCRPFYPQWDRALEQQLVRQFDLPLRRKLKHLSRGMRMKAAFASSLSYHPSLIVLDEPFSGLDPLVRDELIEGLIERATEATIFLSSHDLAEIESFSSHVGFLKQGRLLFSEEMSTLSERFRSVTVTLDHQSPLPANLPSYWLQPEAADHIVHFVHSSYSEQAAAELQKFFPSATDVTLDPMTLRSIFLAVAKSSRNSVASAPVQTTAKGIES